MRMIRVVIVVVIVVDAVIVVIVEPAENGFELYVGWAPVPLAYFITKTLAYDRTEAE